MTVGIGYRPDIDGLRAISVASVLAFHAGLPFVPGGFVGVDVFFVISGYLISKLLLNEFDSDHRISLLGFWARRIRRLAPALLFVMVVMLAVAALLLERISGEVGAVARAALATLLINANHFFLSESGDYFGASAETNPLLHMWSLSVEEQFYLAWPLILFFSLRHGKNSLAWRLAATILVASFALSCYWTLTVASKAFYLMPPRAWELAAGALLAFVSQASFARVGRPWSEAMSLTGLAAIAISIAFFTGKTGFPGPAAALPVAGAVLLLAAGATNRATYITRLLGSRALAYLGKISYPLYLWHWPILVVMRSRRLYQESIWLDVLGLLISIVLAVITYEIVEKQAWRRFNRCSARQIVLFGLTGSAVVFCLAMLLGAWVRTGWGYSPAELRLNASRKDMPKLDCMFQADLPTRSQMEACFDATKRPTALLWGDSHANHWRPAIAQAAIGAGVNAATLAMNACRPLAGPVGREDCVKFNRYIIDNLAHWQKENGLVGLVLSARWPEGTGTVATSIADRASWKPGEYFDARAHSQREALGYLEEELASIFETARRTDLKVLLIMPSPVQKFAASHCLAVLSEEECSVSEAELRPYVGPAEDVIRRVVIRFPMVRLVEPRAFMCRDGNCPVVIDGGIAYTDDDHISKSFSQSKGSEFEGGLEWLAKRP